MLLNKNASLGSGGHTNLQDNGSNFSAVVDPGDHLTGVVFGNNTFVAVGVKGGLEVSTDNGTTWVSRKSVNPLGTVAITSWLRGVGF